MEKVLSASKSILFLLVFVLALPSLGTAVDRKPRLVLMPLQTTGIDGGYRKPMETALVEGLSEIYTVKAGEQVEKKVRDIFDKVGKETKAGHLCDDTMCMEDIGNAFQAELVATASIMKNSGGYLLALSIKNVTYNTSVYSKSIPCKGCDEFNVIDQLKMIAGGGKAATTALEAPSAPAIPGPTGGGFSLDDLDKQAGAEESKKAAATKEEKKAKAKWDKYLEEMKKSYSQVESYEKRDISKELKIAGWEKFMKSYNEDDTYSSEDEDLRKTAEGRINTIKTAGTAPEGMVFVKGGCYDMGDTFGDGDKDEKPVHNVCVDDFYMGKYEVTQKEWVAVMGSNPSNFENCDDCPVEQVSWDDVKEYIGKLNNKTGTSYRLPTEAEWEYAARSGGKKEKWAGTSSEKELGEYAWYDANSGSKTHPVGQKKPNGLGLYDMTGNVWEWTGDWYGENYYGSSPKNNPKGPDNAQDKVNRGGSWDTIPAGVRASNRLGDTPGARNGGVGFRVSAFAQ